MHVPPAGWIFGGQSGTPPPWPFLSPLLTSSCSRQVLFIACSTRSLPSLNARPGGNLISCLLAGPGFGDWPASHHYLQLSVWLTVLAARQHQQAHIVDKCSPTPEYCEPRLFRFTLPISMSAKTSFSAHADVFVVLPFRSFLVRRILHICMTLVSFKAD